MTVNTTILVGNMTDSPELRFLPSGKAVANFTIADTPRSRTHQRRMERRRGPVPARRRLG